MGTVAHSQPHATDSSKLLFFSTNAENGRVVLSSPPALGAGGPEFKSRRPDHLLPCFQCSVPDTAASETQLGSKYKCLHAFNCATLFFRYRVQINLARDFRRGMPQQRLHRSYWSAYTI